MDLSCAQERVFQPSSGGTIKFPHFEEQTAIMIAIFQFVGSKTFHLVLIDFSLTVKAVTLLFIHRRGSAISSNKRGKSGSIYNLVKN